MANTGDGEEKNCWQHIVFSLSELGQKNESCYIIIREIMTLMTRRKKRRRGTGGGGGWGGGGWEERERERERERENERVSWCFTPSQPVRLYQGEREREKREREREEREKVINC